MNIDLIYTWDALPRLLQGAVITVKVSIASAALTLVLATTFTVLRESGIKAAQIGLRTYISFIRGSTLLVQILVVYYGLPQLGIEAAKRNDVIDNLGHGSVFQEICPRAIDL
jgi:His/Glu/Gln/Arg/opine family amino acid ABC transporter permease subunit